MANAAADQLMAAIRQAGALYESARWAECETICRLVLDKDPHQFDALNLSGIVAAQTGRMDEAARRLGAAVGARPIDAGAHNNYGNVLLALGRAGEALTSFTEALRLAPGHAQAHNNCGNALRELGKWSDALASYERAVALHPQVALAHNNRGLALHHLERFSDALASYDRALELAPGLSDAHCNRGDTLHVLRRLEEALQSFDRAIALAPDFAAAFNNRGALLLDVRRPVDALADFYRALQLDPHSADAYSNRGNTLQILGRLPEAVASYDQALKLRCDFTVAHHNRANALTRMNRLDDALDGYARALALDRGHEYAYGTWLFCKARLCRWDEWQAERAALTPLIEDGKPVVKAFQLQALSGSEALLRRAAEIEVRNDWPQITPRAFERRSGRAHSRGEKIRLGYFSADFRLHPVGILTAGVFACHDRSRFETVAFSLGPNTQDLLRQRFEHAFDRFIDVRLQSDAEIAALARELAIDIAVDLSGLTEDSRPGVLALRAAPVQVGMIGFAGTMTPQLVDYLIADRTVIPTESRAHYGEKIIYLPGSYLVNDTARLIADRRFSRAELGLPASGFVFCCFNNSYKLTPTLFSVWMRLLTRVPGSVLWLASGPLTMSRNLRGEAQSRGVDPGRLVFGERLPDLAEHLARHAQAGLALDTLPFNGHSTTIDALWAGLPVLTCRGTTFPGRVAASLLQAIGLPELVAESLEEYEELAVALALGPERLASLRRRLDEHRLTTALFDTAGYTRKLETAFAEIHRRRAAGLPPKDIATEIRPRV